MIEPTDDQLRPAAAKIRMRFASLFAATDLPPVDAFIESVRIGIRKGVLSLRPDGTLDMTPTGHRRAQEIKFKLMQKQN